MTLKRLALLTAFLFLGLSLATTAQAKKFSLTGGGGQLHIGNGLQLPIQAAATAATTGEDFPTLLIPAVIGATVVGTTAKTVLLKGKGRKGFQQKLVVHKGALSKSAPRNSVRLEKPCRSLPLGSTGYEWVPPSREKLSCPTLENSACATSKVPARPPVGSTGCRLGATTSALLVLRR